MVVSNSKEALESVLLVVSRGGLELQLQELRNRSTVVVPWGSMICPGSSCPLMQMLYCPQHTLWKFLPTKTSPNEDHFPPQAASFALSRLPPVLSSNSPKTPTTPRAYSVAFAWNVLPSLLSTSSFYSSYNKLLFLLSWMDLTAQPDSSLGTLPLSWGFSGVVVFIYHCLVPVLMTSQQLRSTGSGSDQLDLNSGIKFWLWGWVLR